MKLVCASNIDRAIRLCNANNALILKLTTAMLVRAQRPYSLNLVYHECLAKLRMIERSALRSTIGATIIRFVSFLLLFAILVSGGQESTVVNVSVGIALVAILTMGCVAWMGTAYRASVAHYLIRLRNALYENAHYVPPEDRPLREMTEDELVMWRQRMESLEAEVQSRQGTGEDVRAADVHDAHVQPDGVLPPI
jgi:hypothetical protein